MELQTNRFLLRDFQAGDESAFLAYHADPRYAEFYAPGEATLQHTEHLLNLFREWSQQQPRQNYQLAIVQRQPPHALIGCAGLRCASLPPGEAEFGMEMSPAFWGRHAYAIEIGRALLDFGFDELDLRVIHGSTISANTRITRLAKWFGAEITTTTPGPAWMAAQNWSNVSWRITKLNWQQRPK